MLAVFSLLDADRELPPTLGPAELRKRRRWRAYLRRRGKWLLYALLAAHILTHASSPRKQGQGNAWEFVGPGLLLIAVVWFEVVLPTIRKRS